MTEVPTPPAQPEKRDTVDSTVDRRLKNLEGRKPFVKGDKRINRKGRPKTFDKLRAMVQETLNSDLKIRMPTGETVETTRLRLMLESMTTGGNSADHRTLLEYGFGKVKEAPFDSMTDDELKAFIAKALGLDSGKQNAE